jgi:hypothetical protein
MARTRSDTTTPRHYRPRVRSRATTRVGVTPTRVCIGEDARHPHGRRLRTHPLRCLSSGCTVPRRVSENPWTRVSLSPFRQLNETMRDQKSYTEFLERATADLAAARQQVAHLEGVVASLRPLTSQARLSAPQDEAPEPTKSVDAATTDRLEMVRGVLRAAGRPMTVAEIRDAVIRLGGGRETPEAFAKFLLRASRRPSSGISRSAVGTYSLRAGG